MVKRKGMVCNSTIHGTNRDKDTYYSFRFYGENNGFGNSDNKRIEYALTLIYGIGWMTSGKICDASGLTAIKIIRTQRRRYPKIVSIIENYRSKETFVKRLPAMSNGLRRSHHTVAPGIREDCLPEDREPNQTHVPRKESERRLEH